jgi:carbamoyl-phosphate synthase small subunit
LSDYLSSFDIPGVEGVDTRALTKILRLKGAMKSCISTEGISAKAAVSRAREWQGIVGFDYVKEVTHKEAFQWDPNDQSSQNWTLDRSADGRMRYRDELRPAEIPIVAVDFGIKYNILRRLRQQGFRVQVVPATATAAEILCHKPAGVFLSNGPGDPEALTYAHQSVRELIGKVPIFGICLGHQILGFALGGRTFKLKFGHRGANQPVKDLPTGKVLITSQNHGFAVAQDSLNSGEVEITQINLNDQTVEGMRHKKHPIFSVQYHPEASPGPHDAGFLFDDFRRLIVG